MKFIDNFFGVNSFSFYIFGKLINQSILFVLSSEIFGVIECVVDILFFMGKGKIKTKLIAPKLRPSRKQFLVVTG